MKKILAFILTLTVTLSVQTTAFAVSYEGESVNDSDHGPVTEISEAAEEPETTEGLETAEEPESAEEPEAVEDPEASEELGTAEDPEPVQAVGSGENSYLGIKWSLDEDGTLELSGTYTGSGDISIEKDILGDSYADCKAVYCDFDPGAARSVLFGTFEAAGSNITLIKFGENFNTGSLRSMYYMFGGCTKLTELDLISFDTSGVEDMSCMFQYCAGLTDLDLTGFNTSNVKDMGSMFLDCQSLTELFLSKFDTSKVTSMWSMFSGCSKLEGLYIGAFNTSNVTDMGAMFSGCYSLKKINLSSFDTSKVKNMESMFSGCGGMETIDLSKIDTSSVEDMRWLFSSCSGLSTIDLSKFNTSNVTDMSGMFSECSGLVSLDLKSFDTSNVTDMGFMFDGCSSLTNLDISEFNTSNVADMGDMFSGCEGLTELDLRGFDTSKTTVMTEMFIGCDSLISLNLKSFNMSSVTEYRHMFFECNSLKELVTPFNNSLEAITLPRYFYDDAGYSYSELPVTENESMKLTVPEDADENEGNFYGISWSIDGNGVITLTGSYTGDGFVSLEENILKNHYVDCKKVICGFEPGNAKGISFGSFNEYGSNVEAITFSDNFDTEKFTSMEAMFSNCWSLTELDLSGFDTSNVTDMNIMFNNCAGLTELDLSGFDTSNVTDMGAMFRGCMNLSSLDLSGFDTSKVTDMQSMFINCGGLSDLRIGTFNTEKTSDISYMFDGCLSLTSLDLSSFTLENINSYDGVFEDCNGLEKIKTPYCNTQTDIELNRVFYGKDGTEYENLPVTSNQSVTIYASNDAPVSSESLTLDITQKTIAPGRSFTISANVTDEAGNAVEEPALSFASNAPAVASVDSEGVVRGVSDGKALITVRYNDLTAVCIVIVDSDCEKTGVWVQGIEEEYRYTGTAIKPVPEVYFNSEKLTEKKDYTVKYSNNLKPGTATVTLNMKGRFSGRKHIVFTIVKLDLAETTKDCIYLSYRENKVQKPKPGLYYNNRAIKYKSKDLEITYPSTEEGAYVKPGTYEIHVAASGSSEVFSGEKDIDLVITEKNLMSKVKVKMTGNKLTYTGEPLEPVLKVTGSGNKVLLENEDYTVTYDDDHTDPGKHTMILEGIGDDYIGFRKYTFTIGGKYDIGNKEYTEIEMDSDDIYMVGTVLYTAGGATPGFNVTYKGEELTLGKDYQVQYLDNKVLGTAEAVIKGKGKYTGIRVETFEIINRDISTLRLNISDVKYSSKTDAYKKNKYVFTDDNYKNQKLKLNRDYTLEYEENYGNPDIGTVINVTIKGIGNYSDSMEASYRVIDPAKDISKAKVVINNGKAYEYTGSLIEPSSSEISLLVGKSTYLSDSDYEVAGCYNNINNGRNALVLLRGINGFTGTRLVRFKIDPVVVGEDNQ
ncbi:MAG: BspA family leucine-rich repeat surface protein [Lachnospiraceae bacterium]|nr:BspA family leucine-rich repeat surface protein [Lachnospiraceae bacterium]